MTTVFLDHDRKFEVGKIVCVGQNYVKHIEEMSAKRSKQPVLFLKPSTSILHIGETILLPNFSNEVHHEVELALLIGKKAKSINQQDWKSHIAGTTVALDLTLRDLQSEAKEKGLPWSVSKGFDGSCPIGNFKPFCEADSLDNLKIQLKKNGELKQSGNTSQMIFPPEVLIAYISTIFTLEPGDIVLTGTPAGVGQLQSGDEIEADIEKVASITFTVS